jgi:hypothetical protein
MYSYAYYLTENFWSKKIRPCIGNAKAIIGEVAVPADNWQWQITFGACSHFVASRAQFQIDHFILITYLYLYATLQRGGMSLWLKGGEMASKKNVSAFSGQITTQQNGR